MMLLNQEHKDFSSDRDSNLRSISDYWRSEGLSVRASNVLANAGINNKTILLKDLPTPERIIQLRNCGKLTAEEIWSAIEVWRNKQDKYSDSSFSNPLPEQTEIPTIQNSNINFPSIELPLLGIRVSKSLWNNLRKISVEEIEWSVRTGRCIKKQGYSSLADIANIPEEKWLKIKNFGRTSLNEIKQTIQEIVNQFMPSWEGQNVPLLNIHVSNETWHILEKISIDELQWSVRTWNCLKSCNCETIADVAKRTAGEWLSVRNFGNTSLTEIKRNISEIINEHLSFTNYSNTRGMGEENSLSPLISRGQHLLENEEIEVPNEIILNDPTSNATSLHQLGELLLKYFDAREREVIKLYYGFEKNPKTLEEVGKVLSLTRERVRQIKENINRKLQHRSRIRIIGMGMLKLYEQFIIEKLREKNGVISLNDLRQLMSENFNWGNKEQGLINWLDDALSKNWLFLGSKNYKANNDFCQIISDNLIFNSISNLVEDLSKYGYKPLTLEACHIYLNEPHHDLLNEEELLRYLNNHPQIKIYEFGSIYIGVKGWEWFNAASRRSSKAMENLIEWFLRIKNVPCTAEEISHGILDRIGNFRISPFTIAEICNANNFRFAIFEHHKFGLDIWKYASDYKKKLKNILSVKPSTIEQIIQRMKLTEKDQSLPLLVVTALNFYQDTFIEKRPFTWALIEQENLTDRSPDFVTLTFEDLIPN